MRQLAKWSWAGRAWRSLVRYAGVEVVPVSHVERIVSAVGGFLAIYGLIVLERSLVGDVGAALLVASMGASAVLLFAVPHGALSQPWAVLVGHTVSALVGVAVARLVPEPMLAAALAVGGAIGAMHYLRAIHPPGGATALTAVIGGPAIHQLGFGFVLMPVLLNAVLMVAAAVVINAAFKWRRYPSAWGRRTVAATSRAAGGEASRAGFTHADFMAALARIGTFVDISEDEFKRLTDLTQASVEERRLKPEDIKVGNYYSNGAFGVDWAVRRVVDADPANAEGSVIWRVVAGRDRNASGLSSRLEFARWADCEVVRSESTWVRAREAAATSADSAT